MAIAKEVIRQCLRDMRDEIENAEIVNRTFTFEEKGNYVFVGVRHVGKSYMLYQRVRELLSAGIGWDEILFVDFEDERLAELQTEDLNTILETHLELYGKKPYIFLDEIQNVLHWDKFVRRLANNKYTLYVTGSNAKMLSKDVATTLGGRFFIVDVYPFSFKEYLCASQILLPADWKYSTMNRSLIKKAFTDYFYFGGLPEIGQFKQKRAMLSSLYQKIYLGDICKRNLIKNDKALNILIKKMAESVKQPISYNRLKNVVVSTGCTISVPTTIDYIEYATDSWLIIPIENELAKLADKESQKKYYFIDNGILNLFLINPDTSLLENMAAIHLFRKYGRDNVCYYKNEQEIDFVVSEEKIALQVSFSIKNEETYKREVGALAGFSDKHPDWQLILLTYDESDTIENNNGTIHVIPMYEYMLT